MTSHEHSLILIKQLRKERDDALELIKALREEQPTCTKYWLKTEDVGIRLNLNHVETAGFVDGEFKLQMTSGRIHKLTSTKDQIIVLNYLTARTL